MVALADVPAVAQTTSGQALFQQRCSACHSLQSGAKGGMGPNLHGVVGRVAGTEPGFAYSGALRASALKLDRATLDRYLAGPTKAVPGSRMPVAVSNPAERAAIIAYLGGQ